MALKEILTHLDFKKVNEIRNVLFHKLTSAPSEPTEGQVYYNTTEHRAEVWNGTAWVPTDTSQLVAGNALTRTGNTFDVAPGTGMEISSDTIRIAAAAAGAGLGGGATEALKVNVGSGIEISSDAVRIAAEAAGEGLGGGGGTALEVKVGTGIVISADKVTADTSVLATREFAESLLAGTDNKASVRLATAAALPTNTLTGNVLEASANAAIEIDGKTLVVGDRILVKNEAEGKKNGIYTVTTVGTAGVKYKLTRATDADISAEVTAGLYVFVSEGTTNENSGWQLFTKDPITLGTTALVFEQVSGAGQITAGAGLTKTGNVLNVGAGKGILVEADEIKVDPSVVPKKFAANIGNGSATEIEVEHKLGTEDVVVEIYRNSGEKDSVECEVTRVSTEKIKLLFNTAPTSNQFRVVVVG